MASADPVQIPSRSLFRQPEVCEIAQVQPYVLRSWEAEFQDLGVAKVQGELSGRTTIEGTAERTADAIAEELRKAFQQQGWI